ncbi:MAG: GHKL domain-containing protein [Clostridiaceae bacterium]|nr:GHKL domain-containing protein [Clostridiaceae bacterium]
MFLLNFASLMLDLPFLYVISKIKNILRKKRYYPLILLIILINFTVVVLNIVLIDFFAFKYNLKRDLSIYIFSLLLILVSAVSSVIISRRISKLRAREQELENLVFYNQILMKAINDLKRVKHNHSNIISSIYGLVKANDWSKLEEFMDDLVSDESKMYSQELISLTSINNGAVLGILDSKLEKARECDVQLNINIHGEINEINMPISQFCEVLGILLDNAVEAAADSEEKYVKLTITGEGKTTSFRIENSCKDKPDISKMFQKDWSTKGEGRGLGLWIVNNIKRKHKNLILNTIVDDNYVLQELIVG